MFTVTKRIEISGAHQLSLPYESKCQLWHGHNWIIIIKCQSETLDENGMVVDFTKVKEIVNRQDHASIRKSGQSDGGEYRLLAVREDSALRGGFRAGKRRERSRLCKVN